MITNYVYKVEEKENYCTTKRSCDNLGNNYYKIDKTNGSGCTLNCNYTFDTNFIVNKKCV